MPARSVRVPSSLTARPCRPNRAPHFLSAAVALAVVALLLVPTVTDGRPVLGGALGASTVVTSPADASGAPAPEGSAPEARKAYGQLPMTFVPNEGQAIPRVAFSGQGPGSSLYFTARKAMFVFSEAAGSKEKLDAVGPPGAATAVAAVGGHARGVALAMRFVGATGVRPVARDRAQGKVNYLIGNDPSEWHTGLPTYREVVYPGLWPGIDMVFRGTPGRIKYEFRVRPGADPGDIRLAYQGAESLSVDRAGSLAIATALGTLTDTHPVSYQRSAGTRVSVPTRFVVDTGRGGPSYGFAVGSYDPNRPLTIDPTLVYSTFLGGKGADAGSDIAIDSSGNAYVTGSTGSSDFPTFPTPWAFDTRFNGRGDVFVTKLNAAGTDLEYSTFLGGSDDDLGYGVAVDSGGNAYVTGYTESYDFPTFPTWPTIPPAPFDGSYNGAGDAFIAKLDPAGQGTLDLGYSTFLGGRDYDLGHGVAVDADGNAYVTGWTQSSNFPATDGAYATRLGGGQDAFVTKLNPAGTEVADLVYSTFLGGAGNELGYEVAVDEDILGNAVAYVTGWTESSNFPTAAPISGQPYDTSYNGLGDAFLTQLMPDGTGLLYSTFLGGSDAPDRGFGIAVDSLGNAYLTGWTLSSDFPTTNGAFDTTYNGGGDAYVTKLNPAGTGLSDLRYSTFLGGTTREDYGVGVAVDTGGNADVTGWTLSSGFPTTNGAFDTTYNGRGDAFVTTLDPAATGMASLVYSTFLGGKGADQGNGVAVDGLDSAYVAGSTESSNFPTTNGALDTGYNGHRDAFVTKIATTS